MEIEFLKGFLTPDSHGKFTKRESKTIEFKENFNMGSLINGDLSKTLAAFANANGGYIIFGVGDKPRKIKGLSNENFLEAKDERITEILNNQFTPEIIFEMEYFEHLQKSFGAIYIYPSRNKPVVCTLSNERIREGEIYFRYSARSEKIKYSELRFILNEIRDLERRAWMTHIQNIAQIGPENIALIDLYRGSIPLPNDKQILIDKKILKDIKIIKEGHFVEKEGAPAIKLIGEVQGVNTVAATINLDEDFYTLKEIGTSIGLLSEKGSTNYLTALIWKYNIQSDEKYFQQKNNIKYYSKICLDFLRDKNITLEEAKAIYRDYLQRNKK